MNRRQFCMAPAVLAPRAAGRPNIVMVYVDELRASALRLYQAAGLATPNLARLASSGVVFDQAFTPHPLCVPARVSLWTGERTSSHGSRDNQTFLGEGRPTMAASLHDAGYTLGVFGKNHCFTPPQLARWFEDYSFDSKLWREAMPPEIAQKNRELRDWIRSRGGGMMAPETHTFPPEACDTHLTAQRAIEFIERQRDRPFCAWISIQDPHHPMQVPARYAAATPPGRIEMPPFRPGEMKSKNTRMQIYDYLIRSSELPVEFLRRFVSIYYGMTAFIDEELGRILGALDRNGLRENTIVVFTSDHGDFAAEHHMIIKTGSLLESMVRIPLVVSFPGRVPRGKRERALVNHLDLMPTLLAWCGLPVPPTAEGMRLPFSPGDRRRDTIYAEYGSGEADFTWEEARALGQPQRLGDYALTKPHEFKALAKREHAGHLRMARNHTHKLIVDSNGEMELYDLEKDPNEFVNVHGRPEYRQVETALRKRLDEIGPERLRATG